MNQSDIDNSLKITDLENMFTIHEDSNGFYRYNLNETLYINVDPAQIRYYTLTTDAFWPLISYKLYNTTRVAWLLMKLNNVKGNQIFDKKRAGNVIKYLDIKDVNNILGVL